MKILVVDSTKKKLELNTSLLLVFLLVFALALSAGCIGEQEGLEIDLNKTRGALSNSSGTMQMRYISDLTCG